MDRHCKSFSGAANPIANALNGLDIALLKIWCVTNLQPIQMLTRLELIQAAQLMAKTSSIQCGS
jgi:hypothetical protein